jgi:hypothetical protein
MERQDKELTGAVSYETQQKNVVKALHYKPEGRGFDSPMASLEFFIDNPSGSAMALGLTQPDRNEYQK